MREATSFGKKSTTNKVKSDEKFELQCKPVSFNAAKLLQDFDNQKYLEIKKDNDVEE